jgi:hypothetical protein
MSHVDGASAKKGTQWKVLQSQLRGNTGVSSRRLQCRNSKVFKPNVAVVRIFVSDIDMEDGDDAASHLPAVDDL